MAGDSDCEERLPGSGNCGAAVMVAEAASISVAAPLSSDTSDAAIPPCKPRA
jgi:hypothetical protein